MLRNQFNILMVFYLEKNKKIHQSTTVKCNKLKTQKTQRIHGIFLFKTGSTQTKFEKIVKVSSYRVSETRIMLGCNRKWKENRCSW